MERFFIILIFLSGFSCNTGADKSHEDADLHAFAGKPDYQLIPPQSIPPGLEIKGHVEEAWKWTDSLGEHILLLSRVSPYEATGTEAEEGGKTSELYARAFRMNNGAGTLAWEVADREQDCPLDLTCEFISGSTTITDLDSNGIAEVKIQYAKTCRGDVSPANMHLVMQDGNRRYTLSGARWVATSPGEVFAVNADNVNLEKLPVMKDEVDQMIQGFGRYENERSFAGAPPAFLTFARSEWLKYAKENIGGE